MSRILLDILYSHRLDTLLYYCLFETCCAVLLLEAGFDCVLLGLLRMQWFSNCVLANLGVLLLEACQGLLNEIVNNGK